MFQRILSQTFLYTQLSVPLQAKFLEVKLLANVWILTLDTY
jgi:hypothetical protein